jgi:hypothetical protein
MDFLAWTAESIGRRYRSRPSYQLVALARTHFDRGPRGLRSRLGPPKEAEPRELTEEKSGLLRHMKSAGQ